MTLNGKRFVLFYGELYLVVGIGYCRFRQSDTFELVSLQEYRGNLTRAALALPELSIEIEEPNIIEVVDERVLAMLAVLYG